MPSMVTHAAVGVAAAAAFAPRSVSGYFLPASILCATVQDLDVIGFYFRLPYGHILGHRGFTHSFFLGLFVSLLFSTLLSRDAGAFSKRWFFYLVFFFLVWASHGVLDALTRGSHGAALLWPFDNHRVFFSWAPIPISPIGLGSFFSKRGLNVFENELFWVWLPSFSLAFFARMVRMLAWVGSGTFAGFLNSWAVGCFFGLLLFHATYLVIFVIVPPFLVGCHPKGARTMTYFLLGRGGEAMRLLPFNALCKTWKMGA